jgi:metal-dependent amidase/aminoacylase/carboxypeptidase family protein
VIEVYKHQIRSISPILAEIKNRNYRFILFMDDLSFEEQEIEYKYDVEVEFALGEGNPCVENNAQLSYEAMILADSCGYKVCDLDSRPTTDDFGYYSQIYPSLYYSLGVGQRAGRKHTATFMPDERALEVGEEFMWQLALSILNK